MPTIVFVQNSEFNLQPIVHPKGPTISGYYKLQPNGKWLWTISSTAKLPIINNAAISGNADTQEIAQMMATAAVNGLYSILDNLP